MAGILSAEDRTFIETLRGANVLQDVRDHLLDQTDGIILVTCADADRFLDIFQYQARTQVRYRCGLDPRIHPLSWHGGVLACASDSPINKIYGADEVFREQINAAPGIKNIGAIALYAHAPCSAAGLVGVGVRQSIVLQMRAKKAIKAPIPKINVACFFHVDYGHNKRTYFLSREHWEGFARETFATTA